MDFCNIFAAKSNKRHNKMKTFITYLHHSFSFISGLQPDVKHRPACHKETIAGWLSLGVIYFSVEVVGDLAKDAFSAVLRISRDEDRHKHKMEETQAKKDCKIDIINAKAEADIKVDEAKSENKVRTAEKLLKLKQKYKNGDTKCSQGEYASSSQWEDFDDMLYNHKEEPSDMLFGKFIKKGGIHLIGGPKSSGKTIVVMTIAESISKGKACCWKEKKKCTSSQQAGQDVFIYDLEMEEDALKNRNGRYGHKFPGIKRCKNKEFTVNTWLKDVTHVIRNGTGDMTVILDNVTRLRDYMTQPVTARKLFDGIKSLQELAKQNGIVVTFILVCHLGNDRQPYNPMTLKDFAVADSLTTGMDSITAISPSITKNEVVFKVICLRHGQTPDQVAILSKEEKPFLHVELSRFDDESNVLPQKIRPVKNTDNSRKSGNADVRMVSIVSYDIAVEMSKDRNAGLTLSQIAEKYHDRIGRVKHAAQVSRILTKLAEIKNEERV